MSSYNTSRNSFTAGAGRELPSPEELSNRMFFSRVLKNISQWDMKYDDMLIRNKISIGENEDPQQYKLGSQEALIQSVINRIMSDKFIPYLDRAYLEKRRILREYARKEDIADFITRIAGEVVIYDDQKKFCKLKPLPNSYPEQVREAYSKNFERIYNTFQFNDGNKAFEMAKRFLIDGIIAYEIVLDDHDRNVVLLSYIDPTTIIPGVHPESGMTIWIQNPENPETKRLILDSKIVFISYNSHNEYSEVSYLEPLIKPYNQFKIIEQTKINFNLLAAQVYEQYKIPTTGLSKQRAMEEVAKIIADYYEEVEWDEALGTYNINGKKHNKFNKQLFLPTNDSGSVELELISPTGHNLNEDQMLDWFYKALKRASKIPFGRFDTETGGGNIYSDAAEMTRDEMIFGQFIDRIRNMFKDILVKPLRNQMILDFPEYKSDFTFLNAIGIEYLSNDVFEDWRKLRNFEKRADIVGKLNDTFKIKNGEEEMPFFPNSWSLEKIMKMTDAEIKEIEAYRLKEQNNALIGNGSPSMGSPGGGAAPGGEGGGGEGGFEEPGAEGGAPEDLGGGEDLGGAPDEGAAPEADIPIEEPL